jgi:hypothetical protein
MYAPGLNHILVLGELNPGPFLRRELSLGAYDGQDLPANTRAIVFVTGDLKNDLDRAALVAWTRKNLRKALDRGVGCFVAVHQDQVHLARQTLTASEETKRAVVRPADAEVIAQSCLRLEPGPFPNGMVEIDCEDILEADTEMLLRRAFPEFDRITLVPLTGGRSAIDGIWRVDAQSSDRELRSPFVVKCGPREAIDMQVRTYRDVVADRVPFRGCAPLCLDRSVAGFSKRLSVSRFVEKAYQLDELIIKPNCPNVSSLIEKIYTGPLHRWRATIQWQSVALIWQFLPRDVQGKYGYGLRITRKKLASSGISVAQPAKMIKRLRDLPKQNAPMCRAHDDLNFRNVFVAEGGSEIILIDFTRAVVRPLSKDIARMDVGFAFDDALNEQQPIAGDILLDCFTGDLFSISLRHVVRGKGAQARLAAIEALRRHILTEAETHGYDPRLEYKVAIISNLLYEAKRQTKWSGIAYRCADALSLTL